MANNYTPAAPWVESLTFRPVAASPASSTQPLSKVQEVEPKRKKVEQKQYKRTKSPTIFQTFSFFPNDDSIQTTPRCLVWAVPYKYPNSYDFSKAYSGNVTGLTRDQAMAVQSPCIIDGVIQATVSTSKRSHIGSLQVVTVDEGNDYITLLAPGDWIFCSMFTEIQSYNYVKSVLEAATESESQPINGIDYGLKFVGKVQSVRRLIDTNPITGQKIRRIVITATSFSEFDSGIYYDPALTVNSPGGEFFASKFLGAFNNEADGMSTAQGIRRLIGILLGDGPKGSHYEGGKLVTPNMAFNIPTLIAKMLGTTQKDDGKPWLKYSSMLATIYGIQDYDAHRNLSGDYGRGFLPKVTDINAMQKSCPEELRGNFALRMVPWINVPIWGVLNSFLMPTINEMYTCLRYDGNGRILPHFIARQIPFNTDLFPVTSHPVTRFLSLPRWKIRSQQVLNVDTCRSNVMRCNFAQVKSQAAITFIENESVSRGLINPTWDEMDVTRNGLCAQITVTDNLLTDADLGTHWTAVVTDRSMGGHLKFSGQITSIGIQEPICEGDNLEYDDIVYHIEGLTHNYAINSMNGQARFTTTIAVSNGVSVDGNMVFAETYNPSTPEMLSSQPNTTLDKE